MLRKLHCICALSFLCTAAYSQTTLTTLPDGGNKKAAVSEMIGITNVTVKYNRPAVKGREGKIYNELVHAGYKDLGFGTSKQAPWRAGANENTTISFTTDVMVEGKPLKAGTYGLFIAYDDANPTLILSNNSNAWGSYFYDPKDDALRVNVKPVKLNESVERLKFEFSDQTDNSATISLMWEKMKFPFKVEVDLIKTQMASYQKELMGEKGFLWNNYVHAAEFAMQHNKLDHALQWSDYALNTSFPGVKNFKTMSTKAMVLSKMGKTADADALMKEAMPMATVIELHQYGRLLLNQRRPKEALDVFKMNAEKNPNNFTTKMGLVRGYSANADFKTALKYAKEAEPMAPNGPSKDQVVKMIKTLEDGKDVN